MNVVIRCALPQEIPGVIELMPHLMGEPVALDNIQVALPVDGKQLLGAAAISLNPYEQRCSGLRGDVFVAEAFRQNGVGTLLLKALANETRRWGVDYLHAWRTLTLPEEIRRLERWGFSIVRRMECFDVGKDATMAWHAKLDALIARMRQTNKLRESVRFLSLHNRDLVDVAYLYSQFFCIPHHQALLKLRALQSQDIAFGALSVAAERDGQLVGIIIWRSTGQDIPELDIWSMEPGRSNSWISLAMLNESLQQFIAGSYKQMTFKLTDTARTTRNIMAGAGIHPYFENSYALQL